MYKSFPIIESFIVRESIETRLPFSISVDL